MLRLIYIVLLHLHPRFFREEFADEMLWIFDQTSSLRSAGILLGDGVRSLITQWMFRSEFEAAPAADHVPVFYTSGSDSPPPGALLNGLVLSVGVFALACFALMHSGGHARVFTYYGSDFHAGPPSNDTTARRPASRRVWDTVRSLFHKAPAPLRDAGRINNASAAPGSIPLSSALILEKQREALLYFNTVPVLAALDRDHDGVISAGEIEEAPAVLTTLDKNHDGKLEAEELGLYPGRPLSAEDVIKSLMTRDTNGDGKLQRSELPARPEVQFDRFDTNRDGVLSPSEIRSMAEYLTPSRPNTEGTRRERADFMRLQPVIAALDADHNGVISMSEMRNAAAALKILDLNGDGRLTLIEVSVDPVRNEAAVIFRLDADFDGRISQVERRNPFGESLKALLDAADRNGDGYVTWDELTREIRRRSDLNHDGMVTWEEMMKARKSGLLNGNPPDAARESPPSRLEGR